MLTINNTLDGYLKNVEIKGNTTQDPNNLADIKSVGDKLENQELYEIPLLSRGENLYNGSVSNKTTTGFSFTVPSYLKEGTYYLSFKTNTGYDTNSVYLKSATPVYSRILGTITRQSNGRAFGSITLTSEDIQAIKTSTNNLRIEVYRSTTDCDTPSELMFCTTNTSTYSLYQEHKLTILSPTQIEKVGDVADRIIEKDGVWGVEKNVSNIKANGNEGWNRSGVGECYIRKLDVKPNSKIICSKYINDTTQSEYIKTHPSATEIIIKNTASIAGLNEFVRELNENNILIKYITTTSTFIPLPQSQQVILRTFANKTNISFLTEIEGSIKAEVPKSTQAVVNTHTTQIDSLNNELERVKKLEESTASTVVTDKDFVVVEQTSNGYFEDVELEGRTLVNKFTNFKKDYQLNSVVSNNNKGVTLTANNSATHSWFIADGLEVGKIYTVSMNIKNSTIDKSLFFDQGDGNGIFTISAGVVGVQTKKFTYNGNLMRFKSSNNSTGVVDVDDIIILEGDHTHNPPSYFEGLKSVGEGTDEIVVSSVSNGIVYENIPTKKGSYISDTGVFEPNSNATAFDYLEIVPGITYGIFTSKYTTIAHRVCYFDKDRKFVKSELLNSIPSKFKVDDRKVRYIAGHFATNTYDSELKMNIFIKDDKSISQTDKKQPLFLDDADNTWKKPILDEFSTVKKGSDGVYRYYKRGEKVVLNSSEDWGIATQTITHIRYFLTLPNKKYDFFNIISDKFPTLNEDTSEYIRGSSSSCDVYINISKSKLETQDVAGFKKWLQANPVTVVYQLHEEKVYECTNIDLITYANETNYIVESGALSPKSTLKVHNNIANVVTLLQKKVSLLENDIKNEQSMQNGMILDTDIRMMDLEFTLEEMLPIKLNLRVNNNMLRGMNEFMLMKDRIECGEYTDEYLEKCINKYKRAGRLTDEEYNDLYNMIYPLEF